MASREGRGLGFEGGRIEALTLPLPYFLGQGVAAGLVFLLLGQGGAAFGVDGEDGVCRGLEAAPGQGVVEGGRVGADGADVVHQDSTGLVSTHPAVRMEISKRRMRGTARPVWVMTSGGVMMAAMMNMPT